MINEHYKLYDFITLFENKYHRKPKFYKVQVRYNNSRYYRYLSYPNRYYNNFGFYNGASRNLGITLSELALNRDILLLYLAYHDNSFIKITDYDEIVDYLLFCTEDDFGKNDIIIRKQLDSDFGFCIAPSEKEYLNGVYKNIKLYKLYNINSKSWLDYKLDGNLNQDVAIIVSEKILKYRKFKKIIKDVYIPIKVELPTTFSHIFYSYEDFGWYINRL